MLERLTTIITEASLKHKEYILKLEKSFKDYRLSTDKSIDILLKNDELRNEFINEKVDKFLASIPLPKDADNEYILGNLKVDVKEYLVKIDEDVNTLTKTNLDKIKNTQDKSIKDISEKLNSFMSQKLDEYREINKKTVDEAIRLQVAKIPPPKDGQDADVDYEAIGEMIAKEISSNKFVKDIEFIQNTNELKIIYTDGTSKKLQLPTTRRNTKIGSFLGGGSESGIEEVTELLQDDFIILTRNGIQVKISVSNFEDSIIPKTVDGGGA